MTWHRRGAGHWAGAWEQRPNLAALFDRGQDEFDNISQDFVATFARHYPEYDGMVGLPSFGSVRLLHERSYLLKELLTAIWHRQHSFDNRQDTIAAAVNDLSTFVDQPTVRFRFVAELINFQMAVKEIQLPDNLRIRKLTEEEVSEMYGGPVGRPAMLHKPPYGPYEFAIEGDYAEDKVFGDSGTAMFPAYEDVRPRIDKIITAMRTFKDGRVGYEWIRFRPTIFCPLGAPTISYGDLHVSFGGFYTVSDEELQPLRQHITRMVNCHEPAMKMACSRLADAQIKHRAEDRLVDAVIGLEALLLCSTGNEGVRGELSFRFALNYAVLFDNCATRHAAFNIAKDLYSLRSLVAHGADISKENRKVGDEKMTLADAAKRACEVLRQVICVLLPLAPESAYRKFGFWMDRYLGKVE